MGASESDPKFTLAPCATFSASITRSTGVVPPAGASRGESKSNCGTPVTLPDCGVTAKATALETSEPFATETVIVLAVATSCAGTETVRTSHFPAPAQFPGVTEPGVSAALPKFLCRAARPMPTGSPGVLPCASRSPPSSAGGTGPPSRSPWCTARVPAAVGRPLRYQDSPCRHA